MAKPFRLALALAAILCAFAASAQSTREAPAGSGQRFQGMILIDPTTGQPYAASGGSSGGAAADQTATNATDGQATRADNQHSVVFNYGYNGTTWDRARLGTGGAWLTQVQNFPATQAVTQSGAWTVAQGAAGTTAWKVDGSAVTQPISAASLPLPTGAALDTSVQAVKTTLGTPFQAGGSIGNTGFAINGSLPAYAATPTFKLDQTTPGSTNGIVVNSSALPSGAATAANQILSSGPVAPGTPAPNSALAGLIYNSTAPTVTNGQQVAQQSDASGNTKVNVAAGSVSIQANGVALDTGAGAAGSTSTLRVTTASNSPIGTTALSGGVTSIVRLPSSAASTNATVAKASGGRVYKIRAYNTTASPIRLKLYNKATAPTVGTDTPFDVFVLPPGYSSFDASDIGWYLSAGISYALVTGAADSDTTAVAAAAVTDLSIGYQ